MTSTEVKSWQNNGQAVVMVDVRELKEFEIGHILDAINVPYAEAEEKIEKLDWSKSHVFYCIHSSWRAPYVANLAADLGHENAYILEGGVAAWNAGGQVIYALSAGTIGEVASYPQGVSKLLKHPQDREYQEKIQLTRDELRYFDGQDGRPAYVAVGGKIYDVTQSRLWRAGIHDPSHGRAMAGYDLTDVLKESPHGPENLKRFPVAGELIDNP